MHYCGPSAILDVMRSANATTVRWLDDSEMRAWRTYVETVGNLSTAIENDLAPTWSGTGSSGVSAPMTTGG